MGDGVPLEPLVRAVGTPIAILERRQLRVVHDRGPRADRGLAVVGVDEVQPRLRQQFLSRDPQRALPCRIQAEEIPVEVGDAQQVRRQREEPVELLLGPLPLDEQADLAADRRQHRQQIRVGLADLAAEEFHDPEDLGAAQHGEAERGVQARAARRQALAESSDRGRRRESRRVGGSTTRVPAGRRLPQRRSARLTAANSSNGSDDACHVAAQRRRAAARSTLQSAPYSHPSAPQMASSIRGAASTSVADSASAQAVS